MQRTTQRRGLGRPQTFNFLGFTFICGTTRRGSFQLQRRTRRDRMRTKLQEIKLNCGAECINLFRSRGGGSRQW